MSNLADQSRPGPQLWNLCRTGIAASAFVLTACGSLNPGYLTNPADGSPESQASKQTEMLAVAIRGQVDAIALYSTGEAPKLVGEITDRVRDPKLSFSILRMFCIQTKVTLVTN
jgi:hypothetical protein